MLCVLYGDYTHFTWWAFTLWAAWLSLTVVGYGHTVYITLLSIQFLVILTVIAMSFMHCGMLIQTNDDLGYIKYIIGNFGIHYAPNLIVVFHHHTTSDVYKDLKTKLLFAVFLATSYVCTEYTDTYKCDVSKPIMLAALGVYFLCVYSISSSFLSSAGASAAQTFFGAGRAS